MFTTALFGNLTAPRLVNSMMINHHACNVELNQIKLTSHTGHERNVEPQQLSIGKQNLDELASES